MSELLARCATLWLRWPWMMRVLTTIVVSQPAVWAQASCPMPDLKRNPRLRSVRFWKASGMRTCLVFFLAWMGVLGVCSVPVVRAELNKDWPKERVVATKNITGTLNSLSPRDEPKFMSISYADPNDERVGYAMTLHVDEKIRVLGRAGLRDLKPGDTVQVTYQEVAEEMDEGNGRTRHVATAVRFVKSEVPGLRSEER